MSESSLDDDLLIAATIAAEEEYSRQCRERKASESHARSGSRRPGGGDSTAFHTPSALSNWDELHAQVSSTKSRSVVASRDLDQCDGLKSPSIQRTPENSQATANSSQDNSRIPQIEEAYSAQNRVDLFRPYGVFVTDFTSSEWCQLQVAFKLHLPERPSKSVEMRRGTKRHEELETEIHVKIPVAVTSREDEWGLRVFNSIFCLLELLENGLTREVPVFGKSGDVWCRGIVDELRLCKKTNTIEVMELKTRGSKRSPSPAQFRTAKLQVMLYRRLLDGLGESAKSPVRDEFLEMLELDPNRKLADVVTRSMSSRGFGNVETLEGAFDVLGEVCDTLPAFSQTSRVKYEYQDDKSVVMEEKVVFDPEWLEERVDQNLQFWCGSSEPCGVPSVEAWKCRFCDFNQICKKQPQFQ